jgi:hypothetical protein
LYKKIHTQAHSDLKRYGEPVPKTKKVKDFLDGITEPSLQPVKFTIAGFPNLMNNFTEASNYIEQIVDMNKKNDAITRSISSTTTTGAGRGRGGEGRGRGRGHGGRSGGSGRGRGGRGGGRGRSRGGRAVNAGCWISYNEWLAMPEEEKDAIRTERANHSKRKLSAITTDDMAQNGQNDGSQIQDRAVRYAEAATAGDQMYRRNRTLISQLRSGLRFPLVREASSVHTTHTAVHDVNKVAFAELNSHANTVVARSTCKVLELTEKSCDVYP